MLQMFEYFSLEETLLQSFIISMKLNRIMPPLPPPKVKMRHKSPVLTGRKIDLSLINPDKRLTEVDGKEMNVSLCVLDILDCPHCNWTLLSASLLVTFLSDFLFMASKTVQVFSYAPPARAGFDSAVGSFGVWELQTCADVPRSSGDLLSSVRGSVAPLFSFC